MGFMAGFGSAFASSFEKENDREFQHNEDDFRLQMQAALNRQQQVNELDRQNAKDVMAAKQIAIAIGKPDSWSAWYYPLHSGAAYETVYNQALSSDVQTGPASNKGATDGSGAADASSSLTSGAKSAVDTQMSQANMTPPTQGGLFSSDPQNTAGGSVPSSASNTPTPDASTPPPTPDQGGAPSNSPNAAPPQDVNSPLTAQGNIPTPSPRPEPPAATPAATNSMNPAPQVANPPVASMKPATVYPNNPNATATPNAPIQGMKPQPAFPGVPNQPQGITSPEQGDTSPVPQQTVPPTPQVPAPQTHPTASPTGIPMPNMGQNSWAKNNPGSSKIAARVAQDMGGQDEYNRVMNSSLITGTPIPGLDGQQVTFAPRGYMRADQVNSLNDALAFQAGAYGPHGNPQDRALADQKVALYRQEEYTKAKMIAIQNGTYTAPGRAAITDQFGQAVPGQFAYPRMDNTGMDVASDKQGEIWINPTTQQRVPMSNLRVFNPGMEKELAENQKAMGPVQQGYNEDKNLFLGMVRTAANMQQIAQQYPAAMGTSGDIAQTINNAKREGFNLASLIHPGLDPEAPGSFKADNSTLGGIESYEKKLYSQFQSQTDTVKKTALAASLLDAQSIRLAYMQAKSMNETSGNNGQRVSQAQFEGLYHAIRSGEQPEGLGLSNADFIMEKYNSLKDKENQMAGPGSPNAAFKQHWNIDSPLSYGSSIDQDIQKDPQASRAFDFFQNLQGNNSLTGKPMDPQGNVGGAISGVINEGKKALGIGQPQAKTVTPEATQLPPDIPQGAIVIGKTPQGQKVYQAPDGKKYLSTAQ